MIKLVNLVVRKPDYSHEEFVERWTGSHAELAKDLPGLVKYATSLPTSPEQSEYDGIVELYFEDMDALKAAFGSEIGERVNADAAEFIDMEQGPTLYVEETTQLDRT
ncbi:EthD family reductase [Haloferax sp. MBLA0076]|uniref:EthD family reductase n=1 Tax=Haloferax litoreum TaxID=2666140 RepID=A0A6A8GMS7_9EURY|nr:MULTISPECIES: EthD domain-containing protein [Haloferax]KAB1189864.1 EthD family reductase [Haloferax sp. CBA1148]MRX23627.1 EthD family reductase [Haloferax litoreum]